VTTGRLIVVEGPDGVGKTTITQALAERLIQRVGYPVHMTTEPTSTDLGQLLRSSEGSIKGRAFALAIAADRTAHVEDEIAPLLAAGQLVISDRYLQSSLVLQRIDGLKLDEIWAYNSHIPPAFVSFYLTERPEVIADRLSAREKLSRLEQRSSPAHQLDLYDEAFRFLAEHGWRQLAIDCHGRTPENITSKLMDYLDSVLH
jgi:dTMP kinase